MTRMREYPDKKGQEKHDKFLHSIHLQNYCLKVQKMNHWWVVFVTEKCCDDVNQNSVEMWMAKGLRNTMHMIIAV